MGRGAIILCGGKSTRMGRDKATLPFGPECMLQRIVRLIGEVVPVSNMVVVAAENQPLPDLPPEIVRAHDMRPERGPVEGLAAGLRAADELVDAFYVTSCDVPLLVPAFVRQMFDSLESFEVSVPRDGQYYHPLAAVYRRRVASNLSAMSESGRLRLRLLFEEVATREIDVAELRAVDPQLETLKNLNTLEQYHSALAAAGLIPDPQP